MGHCLVMPHSFSSSGKSPNPLSTMRTYPSFESISDIFTFTLQHNRPAQSVKCLATDTSLTADPGLASSIPAMSHTFMEIDHEIISMVIMLCSAESFKKGCCQLQPKVCAQSTACSSLPGKSVVRLGELTAPAMTIAVDLGRKPTKQTNKLFNMFSVILTSEIFPSTRKGPITVRM